MTKREIISTFRRKINERNADSTFTNKDLYNALMEQAKWLIKREISKGSIYKSTSHFQSLRCQEVIEVSTIDTCCPIKTNCKIFRTKDKLPEMWQDDSGPIIKGISSIDNTTDFWLTTPTGWQNKTNDPYNKMSKQRHSFFSEGYIWLPEHNPHKININAFYTDDVERFNSCSENKDCTRFLDTRFMVPDWLIAEMMAKALQLLFPIKQLPDDTNINKNPNTKT